MESYSLTILAPHIVIRKNKDYWEIEGESHILTEQVNNYFKTLDLMKNKDGVWEYDNIVEMHIMSKNKFFQGIEIKGCLGYFEEGMKICFDFINRFSENIIDVNVYVLNEPISKETLYMFYEETKAKYQEKIMIFKKQYGDINIKATCGQFYQKVFKRDKWYYKLFDSIKRVFKISRYNRT